MGINSNGSSFVIGWYVYRNHKITNNFGTARGREKEKKKCWKTRPSRFDYFPIKKAQTRILHCTMYSILRNEMQSTFIFIENRIWCCCLNVNTHANWKIFQLSESLEMHENSSIVHTIAFEFSQNPIPLSPIQNIIRMLMFFVFFLNKFFLCTLLSFWISVLHMPHLNTTVCAICVEHRETSGKDIFIYMHKSIRLCL